MCSGGFLHRAENNNKKNSGERWMEIFVEVRGITLSGFTVKRA